jgi:hypothetical protein
MFCAFGEVGDDIYSWSSLGNAISIFEVTWTIKKAGLLISTGEAYHLAQHREKDAELGEVS